MSVTLAWMPGFERFVVAESADSPETLGYCDFAVWYFAPTEDWRAEVKDILVNNWRVARDHWGKAPWAYLFDTGLISHEEVRAGVLLPTSVAYPLGRAFRSGVNCADSIGIPSQGARMSEADIDPVRDRESRRKRVFQLLRRGTAEKMLIGRSRSALRLLQEAYELASQAPRIPSPLFEVSAYRLANVRFRSASTLEELRQVDGLYHQAASDERSCLGPMPIIQRIAALARQRMFHEPGTDERSRIEHEVAESYERACRLAREKAIGSGPRTNVDALIQGGLHNLLELTAYYNDMDYEGRAAGLVSPFEDLSLEDDWVLVGTDRIDDAVRMPCDLAQVELEARGKEGADLLFQLDGSRRRGNHPVWTAKGVRHGGGRRPLLMLARLCRGPATDLELSRDVIRGADLNEAALRDVKRELRGLLEECLGKPGLELLPPPNPGQPLELQQDLKIVGMVSVSCLSAPE